MRQLLLSALEQEIMSLLSFKKPRVKYPINKEFYPNANFYNPLRSARLAGYIGSLFKTPHWVFKDKEIKVTKKNIIGCDGGSFEILIYEPTAVKGIAPCLIYYHGGGFIFGAGEYNYRIAREYCLRLGAKMIFVNYRLAPKHPHPTPVEDCYSALRFAYDNADKYGFDKQKIGVAGESAGGTLSTAVCLMARDRGTDTPVFQLLVYPATDMTMDTDSNRKFTDTPVWNSDLSKMMWPVYVPDKEREDLCYASPMQAKYFGDLPPAYVETAQFDCLHDEAINYANAMLDAGVEVEIFETVGTMHGFDSTLDAPTTKMAIGKRIEFMKRYF